MSFSVAAFTLGCKVNQYDTEAILRDFTELGFTLCDFESAADVYLINTCTVTNMSDKKSRQMINRAYKRNPNALIIAYGCYVQVEPKAFEHIPGVSIALGTQDKHRVAEIAADRLAKINDIEITAVKTTAEVSKRTRAYLKIQDGCDRYCAYCIVPYARGDVKSRVISEVMTEAEALVAAGCKEIVLTGIQIASYGNDLNDTDNLLCLMQRIHNIPGLERLRLGSLEPNIIDADFLQTACRLPKLCDHFHLSLQSGCNRTLQRMNRRYTTDHYAQAAADIRTCFPQATLTTDIIVGFPGETDKDFEESLVFAEKIDFFRIHVFVYSPRTGTPAASFPDQVDQKTKERRSRTFRKLAEKMNHDFYVRYIGQVLPVLFEAEDSEIWEGHTTNYMTVRAAGHKDLANRIVPVMLKEVRDGVVYGVLA